jgi:TolB-like protein/DNA-binding winged helix-turn-helix (wHTH) protein
VASIPANSRVHRFGTYEFEPRTGELRKQGIRIRLEGQPLAILRMLLERPGELVTREELQKELWPADTFVDFEHSLNAAIKRLRGALNDSANAPRYVETLASRGYRFMAPLNGIPAAPDAGVAEGAGVESDAKTSSKLHQWRLWSVAAGTLLAAVIAGWAWRKPIVSMLSPSSAPMIRSLAVLPLENLTGDASQEYFADGMTDALITDLAQIGTLRVISRTSIQRYKGVRKPLPEIARELGVDGIVEGTVMRSGSRIRITSQLIYAPADQHLWAHSYERDLKDVVALQADVAQAIAGEVRAVLTTEQRTRLTARGTTNPGAYEDYLKGRSYWNQRTPIGVEKSIEFFQQAVEKDQNFALAFAGLADAYNFSNVLGVVPPKESSPEAKAAATKALVLDPHLAEAHAALGLVKSHYDFDFPGAQREFLKAIELNPNYSNAHLFYAGAYLTPMGRHEEAIAEMKKTLELDPLSLPLNNMMGSTYLWAGDFEKSFQQFQHTIELDPTFPLVHFFLAGLLAELGRYEEAIKENERGELLLGVSPEEAAAEAAGFRRAFQSRGPQGYWQKNLDLTLKAQKRAGTRYFEAVTVAGAYARAGDKENAFSWLEKSYEDREGQSITLVRWLPDFKSLRGDSRFADLLSRMGLPH